MASTSNDARLRNEGGDSKTEDKEHPLQGLYEFLLREFREENPLTGEIITSDIRPHFNALCEYMAADEIATPSPLASVEAGRGEREAGIGGNSETEVLAVAGDGSPSNGSANALDSFSADSRSIAGNDRRSWGVALSAIREVVRAAWELCDDTANENPPEVPQESWDKLAQSLERLERLIPENEQPASAGHAVTLLIAALSQGNGEAVGADESESSAWARFWISDAARGVDYKSAQVGFHAGYNAAPPSPPEGVREALGEYRIKFHRSSNTSSFTLGDIRWMLDTIDALTITSSRGLVEVAEWHDIGTAPTDGQHFLISLVDSNHTQHVREAWCEIDDHTDKPALIWVGQSFDEGAVILIPKYWTPLPAPPAKGSGQMSVAPDDFDNRDPNERVSIPRIEILNRDKRITALTQALEYIAASNSPSAVTAQATLRTLSAKGTANADGGRKSAEEVGLRVMRQLAEYFGITDHPDIFVDKQAASIVAAAIRDDRAEPVSEALNRFEDFINLPSEYENSPGWRVRDYRHELWSKWTELRTALEAARQARATADEKGGAR